MLQYFKNAAGEFGGDSHRQLDMTLQRRNQRMMLMAQEGEELSGGFQDIKIIGGSDVMQDSAKQTNTIKVSSRDKASSRSFFFRNRDRKIDMSARKREA